MSRRVNLPTQHLCPVHDLLGLTDDGHGVDVQVELVGGEQCSSISVLKIEVSSLRVSRCWRLTMRGLTVS